MIAGRGAAYALLGLAGLLLAVALSSGWSGANRLADRAGDSAAVEEAAAAFVVAYGSFDFRDPAGYTARLAGHAGGNLRDAIVAAAVDPSAIAQRRTTAVRVQSVTVTALSDSVAAAAVRAAHERSWTDAASGQLVTERLQQHVSLRLVREGDRWLVVELLVLGEEPADAAAAR